MFRSIYNKLFWAVLLGATAVTASVTLFIFFFLLGESRLFLESESFLFFGRWLPSEGQYAFGPLLIGSTLVAGLAVMAALPFALALSVLEVFVLKDRARQILRILIDSAAGLPSVVVGLWGLMFLVPRISQWATTGTSLLAAAVLLAFMVTPTLTSFFSTALNDCKNQYWPSAVALGMDASAFCLRLLPKIARRDLLSGLTLTLGRAYGETMAVLFVCGNIAQIPSSLLEPVRTVNTNIALEMAYATGVHRSSLFWGAGLLLLLVLSLFTLGSAMKGRSVG